MEKTYQNVSYFFLAILLVVVWGFYRTYFGLFPSFEDINNTQHFHGLMMLCWFAMLIAQPLLIRYKKVELHRILGKVSYVLFPLILFSIFMVARMGYLRDAPNVTHQQNVGQLALSIPPIFAFAILYVLAITNKRNTPFHMRYMIANSILLIGPGIGRAAIIYGGLPFPMGVEVDLFLAEFVCIGLIVYDLVKHGAYKPYLIALAIFIAFHLCWEFQMAWWWQAFAGKFADLLF